VAAGSGDAAPVDDAILDVAAQARERFREGSGGTVHAG
jgi:hypothetical protein